MNNIIPPYLKKGDTIAIVCPSGHMDNEKAEICIQTLMNWGFNVQVGPTLGGKYYYFSGTDEQRLNDLQAKLDDPNVKAILCGRGGYGLTRIMDRLDFEKFKQHPKWVIGYSDITLLHTHLNSKLKIASLHAPMAGAFNDGGATSIYVKSLKTALSGAPVLYKVENNALNRPGIGKGKLVGGNLCMLANGLGTASEVKTKNKILFIEEVGEYIYSADRMFAQLKRAGKLKHLSGLIIGSFSDMKDTTTPFGSTIYEAIKAHIAEYKYPVAFGFPVGHEDANYALKSGVRHELKVTKNKVSLQEKL